MFDLVSPWVCPAMGTGENVRQLTLTANTDPLDLTDEALQARISDQVQINPTDNKCRCPPLNPPLFARPRH